MQRKHHVSLQFEWKRRTGFFGIVFQSNGQLAMHCILISISPFDWRETGSPMLIRYANTIRQLL